MGKHKHKNKHRRGTFLSDISAALEDVEEALEDIFGSSSSCKCRWFRSNRYKHRKHHRHHKHRH